MSNEKKFSFVGMIFLVTIALVLSGCNGLFGNAVKQNQAAKVVEPIKIGFISPLSGDVVTFGQSTLNGLTLGIEDVNANGGILGRPIQLIVEDGKCSGKDATAAATKLINVDKVQFIIGGFCSAETLAAAPVAESSKVILFSPTSSNPSITNAGDYVFRNYPSDSMAGAAVADLLYKEGARKVAVIYANSDGTSGIRGVFVKKFTELSGKVVVDQSIERQAIDVRAELTKIKQTNPDAIAMFAYNAETITTLKQAFELHMQLSKFIGIDAWDDNSIWEQVKGISDGTRLVAIDAPLPPELKQRYVKRFNSEPLLGSAQSYDIPFILKLAAEKAGTLDSTAVKNELYKIKDFHGAAGVQSLDENGDLIGANYVVKVVKDGAVVKE